MRVLEHKVKELFSEAGIRIPKSYLLESYDANACHAAEQIGFPLAVKAQVPFGKRGKAGAVQKVCNSEELALKIQIVKNVDFESNLKSISVMLEEWVQCEKELYLGISIDYIAKMPVLLLSDEGGIEIEQCKKIEKIYIDYGLGPLPYEIIEACKKLNIEQSIWNDVVSCSDHLYLIFKKYDATLVEINPLGVTADSKIVALDGKLVIEDDSLFRQPAMNSHFENMNPKLPDDVLKRNFRLDYIPLTGEIGLISGGAGMTLAAMDLITDFGGRPACFLDCSNNPTVEGYGKALEILSQNTTVKAILINIFGGLTKMDEVAAVLSNLLTTVPIHKPVVVRLEGTNREKAAEILMQHNISFVADFESAVKTVVRLAKGGEH